MRALALSLSLAIAMAAPAFAEAPRMLRIHIIEKSGQLHRQHHHGQACKEGKEAKASSEPNEVNIRVPLRLAKGILGAAGESEIKINGKTKKGIKVDELQKLLEASQPGEMLLEITSDKGDLVKITVE